MKSNIRCGPKYNADNAMAMMMIVHLDELAVRARWLWCRVLVGIVDGEVSLAALMLQREAVVALRGCEDGHGLLTQWRERVQQTCGTHTEAAFALAVLQHERRL